MTINKLLFVIVLSAVVYFSNLGGTSIYILDEAKNAGCAMEMKDRSDMIVPTFNGTLRTDKPPLHYYFMMVAYSLFGVSSFAARFFSALAGVMTIIIIYKSVSSLLNETAAFYTVLVLLASLQLTIQFHLAVPDPYLILFMVISMFSFFNGFHDKPSQLKWFYVSSALGFLTKGLIAVVIPAMIIVLYLFLINEFKLATLKRLKVISGSLMFAALALPWYFAVGYKTNGAWLTGFFIEHNIGRYTSTMEGHSGFPLAPLVILLAALLPFSVFCVQAFVRVWREKDQKPLLLYCAIVVFVFVVFFSISKTILPSYVSPAIPFLAVILGYHLANLGNQKKKEVRTVWIGFVLNFLVSIAICVGAYVAVRFEESMADMTGILWIFFVLPPGICAGFYFYLKQRIELFIYCWSGSWIILALLFFYVVNPMIDARNPVNNSVEVIQRSYPDHTIVGYKIFNPAFVFGLRHPIKVIDSDVELTKITAEDKIVVITRKKYSEELPPSANLKLIYSGKDLFEDNETVVLAN